MRKRFKEAFFLWIALASDGTFAIEERFPVIPYNRKLRGVNKAGTVTDPNSILQKIPTYPIRCMLGRVLNPRRLVRLYTGTQPTLPSLASLNNRLRRVEARQYTNPTFTPSLTVKAARNRLRALNAPFNANALLPELNELLTIYDPGDPTKVPFVPAVNRKEAIRRLFLAGVIDWPLAR